MSRKVILASFPQGFCTFNSFLFKHYRDISTEINAGPETFLIQLLTTSRVIAMTMFL